jgi:helix-turn-helix protein
MKKDVLTVKELAAELRMSVTSVQRGYRKGDIPVQWLGRMARFDLAKVRRAMERNGRNCMRRLNGNATPQGAIAGLGRRRAQQKRPRSVIRGLVSQQRKEA